MALSLKHIGHRQGPAAAQAIELYLDYNCPYSKKIFNKLNDEFIPAIEKKHPNTFQFIFRQVPQPWHPQSTMMHEAALAVERVDPEKFWAYSKVLFDHIEDFYDSATYELSRKEQYEKLALLSKEVGLNSTQVLRLLSIDTTSVNNGGNAVTNDLKPIVRYARQNGVHMTPTVAVNGVIVPSIESSSDLDHWLSVLDPIAKL